MKTAKNSHVVRKLKIDNTVDPSVFKLSNIMFSSLIDQLQLCSATSSLQLLFAQPTSTYKTFCPIANHKEKKRVLEDKEKHNDYEPKKKKPYFSLVNTTGKKIFYP